MAQLMEHMKKDHEREDFVHTESNTYRSHFIVQSSDFTREIMWISDHIVLGNNPLHSNTKSQQARQLYNTINSRKLNKIKIIFSQEEWYFFFQRTDIFSVSVAARRTVSGLFGST